MHTFFINTSGKEFENYSEIFEIQHETRRLVSLDCPLSEWNDKDKGYKACVQKMGELIDSYKDINNDFNLIMYIDLLSYDKYTSIPMVQHRDRYACLTALRVLLKHYIKCTLIERMNEFGRVPREILLIFEENKLPTDGDRSTDDGKKRIRIYLNDLLGLPSVSELDKIIYDNENDKDVISADQLCQTAKGYFDPMLGEGILPYYLNLIEIFLKEVNGYTTSEQPLYRLFDRIMDAADDDDRSIASVTFETNRHAGLANKQEKTHRDLRLCFYIFECVDTETVFDKTEPQNDNNVKVKKFPKIDWDAVAEELLSKKTLFQKKYRAIQKLSESFSELNLAPPLQSFDNERFALDEYGKKLRVFEIVDETKARDTDTLSKDIEDGIVRSEEKKSLRTGDKQGKSCFSKEEYPTFDYKGDKITKSTLDAKTTPEEYIVEAQKLSRHHMDYLQRLKVHLSDRLSNYAGRSSENEPALLRKRKVSVSEEDFDNFDNDKEDYKDAKSGKNEKEKNKKLKNIKDISKTAYESTLLNYMEFCAGKSVSVTNIEEQCNYFITRVHQIKESLRKIQVVFCGLLIALIALYIPFIVLQWEMITDNVITLSIALASIGIPLVLLCIIVGIVSLYQRRKYREAWIEFKTRSDSILEKNALAAEKYDRLLTVYIPFLRWVYEYKLDVDFYEDCCKIARAKIGHHTQKIHDRIITVGNIIEDLEIDMSEIGRASETENDENNGYIDYNISFCSGNKNKKFYSIIDNGFLTSVYEKEEGEGGK